MNNIAETGKYRCYCFFSDSYETLMRTNNHNFMEDNPITNEPRI